MNFLPKYIADILPNSTLKEFQTYLDKIILVLCFFQKIAKDLLDRFSNYLLLQGKPVVVFL